jgi:hypothetical protein
MDIDTDWPGPAALIAFSQGDRIPVINTEKGGCIDSALSAGRAKFT